MALSPGERARLGRIEAELAGADPALVARFRRWGPSAGREPPPSGWSTVDAWILVVFLVAFCTWTLAPFVGSLVATLAMARWWWERRTVRGRARRLAEGDTGWWYRPIDRW